MTDYIPDDFEQDPSPNEPPLDDSNLDGEAWSSAEPEQTADAPLQMTDYASDDFVQEPASGELASITDTDEWAAIEPVEDVSAALAKPAPFVLENLTLMQALELLIYRPVRASRELMRIVLNADQEVPVDEVIVAETDLSSTDVIPSEQEDILGTAAMPRYSPDDLARSAERPSWISQYFSLDREQAGTAGIMLFAILFALFGAGLLREAALDPAKKLQNDLNGSPFWLFMAALMYLMVVFIQSRDWWADRLTHWNQWPPAPRQDMIPSPTEDRVADEIEPAIPDDEIIESVDETYLYGASERVTSARLNIFAWVERYAANLFLIPIAMLLSWLAYDRNVTTDPEGKVTGVVFTKSGFTFWILSILLWYVIMVVDLNRLYRSVVIKHQPLKTVLGWQWKPFQWRWAHVGLLLILLAAVYFRMHRLDDVPPEMTSDHIEKLINALDVDQGYYGIFFANNGGREAFQMYLVAAIADWGGVGFNLRALKYATILEGIFTILLSFWVAKTIIGRETEERERLGNWVGLIMAGLMAVSSWHTMLSRLGLRIVLTPLTVLAVTYFLVRAIRYRRRIDFVHLGLMLGFGTYFYQANRMLPILAVVTIALAIVFQSRGQWTIIWRYASNFVLTGIIAIMVYLPMHHYSQQYPREYWSRTYGRIFGERSFDCIDEQGRLDFCPPSILDAIELLKERRYGLDGTLTGYQAFRQNYKDALLSYMWDGDGQWITNGGGYPALDSRTAALYMLGLLVWLVFFLKRRDVALLVIPIGILVMLLPSALAIANGLSENPSFTRTSGTLPFVYFVAALPLALFAQQIIAAGKSRTIYHGLASLVVIYFIFNAARPNYDAYFKTYYEGYERGWKPYHDIAAPLDEFAHGRGSFGNAFYVHTEHWLDHRILGSVAGDFTWPNGLLKIEDVYQFMLENQDSQYVYDPQKPLLFYINPANTQAIDYAMQNFPGGQLREVPVKNGNSFYVYEAPAGWDWLAARLATETARLGCIINCLPGPR